MSSSSDDAEASTVKRSKEGEGASTSEPKHSSSSSRLDASFGVGAGGGGEQSQGKNNSISSSDSSASPPGFWDRLEFTKAFYPDTDIPWASIYPLSSSHPWSFCDERVNAEYTRFIFRDLSNSVPLATISLATVIWPPLRLAPFKFYWEILFYVISVVLALLCAGDWYLHFFKPLTSQNAALRKLIALVGSIVCAIVVGPSVRDTVESCDVIDYLDALGFTNRGGYGVSDHHQTADISGDSNMYRRKYCFNLIRYYTVCLACVLLNITRLPPPTVVCISVFHFIMMMLPDAYTDGFPERPEELAVKLMFYISVYFICVGQSYIRYTRIQKQFEVSVAMARGSGLVDEQDNRIDTLLTAMLHEEVLDRIVADPTATVFNYTPQGSVFFSDMVNFTKWTGSRKPEEVVTLLNILCIDLDRTTSKYKMEKIKTIGDAYWATCGLPLPVLDHVTQCYDFASAFFSFVEEQNILHPEWGEVSFRVGLHCGPLYGAVLGSQQLSYEAFGATCAVAMLVEANGVPGKICVTEDFLEALSSSFPEGVAVSQPDDGGPRAHQPLAAQEVCQITPDETAMEKKMRIYQVNFSAAYDSHVEEDVERVSVHPSTGSVVSRVARMKQVAKSNRKRFIEKRAERRKTQQKVSTGTLDVIRQKYTERKHSWIFMDFKNEATEKHFNEFLNRVHQPMRLFTKMCLVVLAGLLWIALMIEGIEPPLLTTIFLLVAVFLSIASLLLAALKKHPLLEASLSHLQGFLSIVGCGIIPFSTVGNSTVWLQLVLTALVSLGTVALNAVTLVTLNIVFFLIPSMYFEWPSVYFAASLAFCFVACIVGLIQIVVSEKAARHQFLEEKIGRHFRALEVKKSDQQAMLLEAMVPRHVISDLMKWLDTDLDPRETILRNYDSVVVGFLQLNAPTSSSLHNYSSANSLAQQQQHSNSDHQDGTLAVEERWMIPAHKMVDKILKDSVDSAMVLKIKTIGNTLLLAGPFDARCSVEEASDAMLAVVITLCKALGLRCKVGLHVGSVMGAVLGTSRLAFDIFGDCVNVASRCMTANKADDTTESGLDDRYNGSQVSVSEEFHQVFCLNQQHRAHTATKKVSPSTGGTAPTSSPSGGLDNNFFSPNPISSSTPDNNPVSIQVGTDHPTTSGSSDRGGIDTPSVALTVFGGSPPGTRETAVTSRGGVSSTGTNEDGGSSTLIDTPTSDTTFTKASFTTSAQQGKEFSSLTSSSRRGETLKMPTCEDDARFSDPKLVEAKGKSNVRTRVLLRAPTISTKIVPLIDVLELDADLALLDIDDDDFM